MKRFRSLALILALCMLCGCGQSAAPNPTSQGLQAQSQALQEAIQQTQDVPEDSAGDPSESAPEPGLGPVSDLPDPESALQTQSVPETGDSSDTWQGTELPPARDLTKHTPWDWDGQAIDQAIAHTAALLAAGDGSPDAWPEIAEAYRTVMALYDEYSDLALLYSLYSDLDPRDEAARQASREFDDLDPYDQVAELIGQLLDSAYWEDFLALTENQRLWSLYGYEAEEDEAPSSQSPENRLIDQFEDLYYTMDDLEVTYRGETWTWNRFMEESDDLPGRDYYALGELLERNENEHLGQVQVDLINLRNRQARAWGYDNYYAMAWESYYFRDYTMDEYQIMYQAIMDNMAELYERLDRRSYAGFYDGDDGYDWDLSGFYAYAARDERLPEDLRQAFQVFDESNLLFVPEDTGFDSGYMVKLFGLGLPVIYLYPYHSMYDLISVSHESGHALNGYLCQDENAFEWNWFGSLDVCETQSNSTTLMLMDTLADFCPELGEEIRLEAVLYLVESLVWCAVDDEIERALYEYEGTLTLEIANEIANDCYLAAGMDPEDYFSGAYLSWSESEHLAAYPCYTVSYVVSAAAALGIWLQQVQDPEAAWTNYERVLRLPSTRTDYLELLDLCGLDGDTGVFTSVFYEELAEYIQETFLAPRIQTNRW